MDSFVILGSRELLLSIPWKVMYIVDVDSFIIFSLKLVIGCYKWGFDLRPWLSSWDARILWMKCFHIVKGTTVPYTYLIKEGQIQFVLSLSECISICLYVFFLPIRIYSSILQYFC